MSSSTCRTSCQIMSSLWTTVKVENVFLSAALYYRNKYLFQMKTILVLLFGLKMKGYRYCCLKFISICIWLRFVLYVSCLKPFHSQIFCASVTLKGNRKTQIDTIYDITEVLTEDIPSCAKKCLMLKTSNGWKMYYCCHCSRGQCQNAKPATCCQVTEVSSLA